MRAGRVHGRLAELPTETLARLRVVDGAVHTDRRTAAYLAELAVGEARYLCSWEATVANGVVRGLVERLLAEDPWSVKRVADMTDGELWGLLLSDPRTAEHAERLRRDPLGWEVVPGHAPGGYGYRIEKLYLDTACVDGAPVGLPAHDLPDLPWSCTVRPRDDD